MNRPPTSVVSERVHMVRELEGSVSPFLYMCPVYEKNWTDNVRDECMKLKELENRESSIPGNYLFLRRD